MRQSLRSPLTLGLIPLGTLLLFAFPLAATVMSYRPSPLYGQEPIPIISWGALGIWTEPGWMFAAAAISWLGLIVLAWTLLARRWAVALVVSLVGGLLLLCSAGYSAIDASIDHLRLLASVTVDGRQHFLFQVQYPSGPTEQALYGCNAAGWWCEPVTLPPLRHLEPSEVEAYVRGQLSAP